MKDPKPSVFAIVQDKHGAILLVRKKYGKFDWTCPGGFMETGETPQQAISRETKEESNCTIRNIDFRHVYAIPDRSDVILTFTAEIDKVLEWNENNEISERSFFTLNNLPKPMTNETLRKIKDALSVKNSQLLILATSDL